MAVTVTVNNEPWLVQTISVASGTRVAEFRDAVRHRDRRCVVTGRRALNTHRGIWRGFQAVHVFTKGTGFSIIMAVGLTSTRNLEGPSILFRMVYC